MSLKISIRNFIIFLTIITFCSFSYNSQRAEAFSDPSQTYIVIAGSAEALDALAITYVGTTTVILPYVAGALVICAGFMFGLEVIATYKDDVEAFIAKDVENLSESEVNKYFYHHVDDNGQNYIGLTDAGLNWAKNEMESLHATTLNTIKGKVTVNAPKGSSFTGSNGLTMNPYAVNVDGTVYSQFSAHKGDRVTVSYCYGEDYSLNTYSYDVTGNWVFRFIQSGVSWTYLEIDKGSGFSGEAYISHSLDLYPDLYIGYKIVSPDVQVTGSQMIQETGDIVGVPDTQTLAIPVACEEVSGMPYYTADSASLTKAKLIPKTQLNIDVDSDVEPKPSEKVDVDVDVKIDPKTITEGIEDTLEVPKDDVPKLDFTPLMIATRKFPFCIPWDMYECVKIFEAGSEPFKYEFKEVKYSNTDIVIIPNFTIDFSTIPNIEILVGVFKFIEYLLFVVFLINKIRSLMRS